MIGPALAAASVVGVGATAYAGWPRWSAQLHRAATRRAQASPDLGADLAALDQEVPAFVARSVGRAGMGLVGGLVLAILAWGLVGPLGVVAVPAGAGLAAISARWSLARQASAVRVEMRLATLELAELVSLAIGAGLGVPAALARAATAGTGGAGGRLRRVIESSATPWTSLEDLSETLRVAELGDFARSLAVGVEQQARTREVLLGWAQAARAARLEETEASAGTTTEAMTGPLALVAFGFLLTVGVPAVLQLLSGVRGVHL